MSDKKLKKLRQKTKIENAYEVKTIETSNPETITEKNDIKEDKKIIKKNEIKKVSTDTTAVKESVKKLTNQEIEKNKKIENKSEDLAQKFPFRVGEKVTYSIRYLALEAGRFTFEVKPFKKINNKPVFHFYVSAVSSSVFSLFYSVKDFAESFWDMEAQRPFLMKIYGKESRYVREVQTSFDWIKKQARYQAKILKDKKDLDEEDKTWTLNHMDAQDIVSALYFLRMKDLSVGKVLNFRVAEKGKDIIVKVKVIKEEILKTAEGKFNTYVVQPSFNVDGNWKQDGDITIWLTKDERKIPLQFEAKIKIGAIRGRLQSLQK